MNAAPGPPTWLLGLIALGSVLGGHVVVPALPMIASALHVTSGEVQSIVSLYIGGLALGQLFYV